MDPKFKANFIFTKDYIKNLCSYLYFFRPYRLTFNIILLLCFMLSVYMHFVQHVNVIFNLWFIPLFFAYEIYAYFRGISLYMKRNKETHSDGSNSTYEFFDDHFKFTTSIGANYTVEYSNIVKVVNTKKLVVLISKAKMAYWFPIDSLDNSDLDSFKSFLKEKGIKVK